MTDEYTLPCGCQSKGPLIVGRCEAAEAIWRAMPKYPHLEHFFPKGPQRDAWYAHADASPYNVCRVCGWGGRDPAAVCEVGEDSECVGHTEYLCRDCWEAAGREKGWTLVTRGVGQPAPYPLGEEYEGLG